MKNLLNSRVEDNMMHNLSQVQPLRSENADLKNTILACQTYLEQQRNNLAKIIRNTESRELVKRIANIPTLIEMLEQDYENMQQILERQIKQLEEQSRLLAVLQEEREANYSKMKREVSEKADRQEEIIKKQEQMIKKKEEVIEQLNVLVEDENKKVRKNQNNHFEIVDSYNERVEQLTQQLQEQIEKEQETKSKFTQMLQQQQADHQTQVAIKQDQYEFALGELRNTYEKRMDKLIKDSEFRISEANKASIRANKELEQLSNKYDQEISKSEQQVNFIKSLQLQLQQQQQQTQSYKGQMQQQQLYLHQTQAIIANLRKNNLLTQANEDQISQLELHPNMMSHKCSEDSLKHEEQQTSPSLYPLHADMSNFSPSGFKIQIKYITLVNRNADKMTTQCSPMHLNRTEEKINTFNLECTLPTKPSLSLTKKLKKRKNQRRALGSEDYRGYTNDCFTNCISGPSPRQSEETPQSQLVHVNFTQALNYNQRRRSRLQINYSNNRITEQEIQNTIPTQDVECQTEDQLFDFQNVNENQKTINTQQLDKYSPIRRQLQGNHDSSLKNQHQFSLQILQSDQEEQQISRDEEINLLRDQIKQLEQQNQFQRKSIIELQENTAKIEQTLKENVKLMQQQIRTSQSENENLLKQLDKPKEMSKKKLEMQKHLENQITRNDSLQEQLVKAAEVIKYFNQELENYKQAYNIFGSKEKQKQKLPSLYQPSPKRKMEKKQYSMYEETQRLIENLYNVAPARLKRN